MEEARKATQRVIKIPTEAEESMKEIQSLSEPWSTRLKLVLVLIYFTLMTVHWVCMYIYNSQMAFKYMWWNKQVCLTVKPMYLFSKINRTGKNETKPALIFIWMPKDISNWRKDNILHISDVFGHFSIIYSHVRIGPAASLGVLFQFPGRTNNACKLYTDFTLWESGRNV